MFVTHPKWRRAARSRERCESQYHDPAFQQGKTVLTYCASGGRSALAGQILKEMGYRTVYNIGGFKELADAGLETEPASQT
jgi:rhodanese-related sulfurtransferase